jgi:hypothetical protein
VFFAAASAPAIVEGCTLPKIRGESNEAAAPANAEPRNPRRETRPNVLLLAIYIPLQIIRDLYGLAPPGSYTNRSVVLWGARSNSNSRQCELRFHFQI